MPKPEQSVTEHTIKIGGAVLKYKATAGTLLIRNDDDEPIAAIEYVAYTKDGAEAAQRPLTFAYNGGPGSSSLWLHMGALGPRRIVTTDAAPTPPPPYQVVDNQESILDSTDLVMIDPVGTGLSRAVGKAKDKDFWGVDQDIDSIARFVVQYVNDNGRWNSPKYLLGESYGTMRSAGLVDVLQSRWNMAFNGVVLISVFVDAKTDITMAGNDLGYEMFVPSYAAIAWYHHLVADPPPLDAFLAQAREFAAGPYATALAKGDALPEAERKAVIATMSRLTGLSPSYLDKANLRVSEGEFTAELLREHSEIVGRLDARFTGVALDRLAQGGDRGSAIHGDLRGVHRRVPQLPARGPEVRRGQDVQGRGRAVAGVGLEAQATGRAVPVPRSAEYRHRPGARDRHQPRPAGARAQRVLRPGDAVLRHRVHDGAPRAREEAARQHRDEVFRGGPHDVPAPAVAGRVQGGDRRLHQGDRPAVARGARATVPRPAAQAGRRQGRGTPARPGRDLSTRVGYLSPSS